MKRRTGLLSLRTSVLIGVVLLFIGMNSTFAVIYWADHGSLHGFWIADLIAWLIILTFVGGVAFLLHALCSDPDRPGFLKRD